MGCDIHVYLERKNNDGKWVNWNFYFENTDKECYGGLPYIPRTCYPWRNYELFGILAGVRSYYTKPIDELRGIPNDVCNEIKCIYDLWRDDAHSSSFYYLYELEKHVSNEKIEFFLNHLRKHISNLMKLKTKIDIFMNSGSVKNIYSYDHKDILISHCNFLLKNKKLMNDWIKFNSIDQIPKDHDIRVVFWFDS